MTEPHDPTSVDPTPDEPHPDEPNAAADPHDPPSVEPTPDDPTADEPETDEPNAAADPLDLAAIERDLAGVEAALGRLDDGTYWTDEVTGDTIPDAVLAADPVARRAGGG